MAAPLNKVSTKRVVHNDRLVENSGAWAKEARQAASVRVLNQGLPERRDEYWKYTRPDTFVQNMVTLETQSTPNIDIFEKCIKGRN